MSIGRRPRPSRWRLVAVVTLPLLVAQRLAERAA